VSADDFFATITNTAEAMGVTLLVQAKTTHAIDHPIGFAEGAYLKCLFASTIG